MGADSTLSRRDFLAFLAAAGACTAVVPDAWAQAMPLRRIPSSGELLPIIGLGSSKPVSEIADQGTEAIAAILRSLVEHGGRVIDTWPRDAANDAALGRVLNQAELREKLFVTTKVSVAGAAAGVAQLEKSLRSYGRKTIDLAQVLSLTDIDVHWRTLVEWKSSGRTRYTGVTVSEYGLYDELEKFLRHEKPDFVQLNYSVAERRAEQRLLPLAQERGIAVLINRPFMNGNYFQRLRGKPVPSWAAEAGIQGWAEFSLKYILPHPAITCVLTETSNPAHMIANAKASSGGMPDEAMRRRMAAYIEQV